MTNKPQESRRSRRSAEFWQETIASWRRSGLSAVAYAAEHGLAAHSLYGWEARLRKKEDQRPREAAAPGAAQFVPVEVVGRQLGSAWEATGVVGLEIAWPSGAVIRLHGSVCRDVLVSVVRTVAEVTPC